MFYEIIERARNHHTLIADGGRGRGVVVGHGQGQRISGWRIGGFMVVLWQFYGGQDELVRSFPSTYVFIARPEYQRPLGLA